MNANWLAAATVAFLMSAPSARAADAPTDLTQAPRMGRWGFDLSGRDGSKSAGASLFDYANGAYLERLTIPADRSSYGAFNALDELSRNRMRAVIDKAAADRRAAGPQAKVGALYRSFMDEARVESLGAKPLAADLSAVRAARTRSDIARLMGASAQGFGQSYFTLQLYDDAKDPLKYAVYLGQGGLTLPDRDYYLEARFAPQLTAYEAYITRMLGLAGWPKPAAAAKAILAMETEVARVSWSGVERRDACRARADQRESHMVVHIVSRAWHAARRFVLTRMSWLDLICSA